MKRVDKEWEGRTRSFIMELVNQKFVLEQKLRDKEAENKRFKMKRKITARMHKQQLKSKDTMLLSVVFILAGLYAVVIFLRGCTFVFVFVSKKYYS